MATTIVSSMTAKQTYDLFAPFFEATRASGSSKFVTYDCVFCMKSVEPETVASRSFTGTTVTWAHTDCLRTIPGASISTDRNKKRKAHEAFKIRQTEARKLARAAAEPTVHVDVVNEEAIRERIEAEYEDRMVRAVNLIQKQQADIARLQETVKRMASGELTEHGRQDEATVALEPTPVKRGPGRPRKAA